MQQDLKTILVLNENITPEMEDAAWCQLFKLLEKNDV
jgi:hypothetical protein